MTIRLRNGTAAILAAIAFTAGGCAAMRGALSGAAAGNPAMAIAGAAAAVPDDLVWINRAVSGPTGAPVEGPDARSGPDATREGATVLTFTAGRCETDGSVDASRHDMTDWYAFTLTRTSRFTARLNVIDGDADLELHDGEESLAVSARTGQGPVDFIQYELERGMYYVRVYALLGKAEYTLEISVPVQH